MQLRIFKTLWGHEEDFETACRQAKQAGFDGIEGPIPTESNERRNWRRLLDDYQLDYIAEICTAGSYVPQRNATLSQHLTSLEQQLKNCNEIAPLFVTCLGGCDAWEEECSLEFFFSGIGGGRALSA